MRSSTIKQLAKSEPSLLFHDGDFLASAMKRERVTQEEVLAAVRQQGKPSLDQIGAVVLETDGIFSILSSAAAEEARSTLQNVRTYLLSSGMRLTDGARRSPPTRRGAARATLTSAPVRRVCPSAVSNRGCFGCAATRGCSASSTCRPHTAQMSSPPPPDTTCAWLSAATSVTPPRTFPIKVGTM